jgi:hypothetical protein
VLIGKEGARMAKGEFSLEPPVDRIVVRPRRRRRRRYRAS